MSPAKKPRPTASGHQGRDYDLNEIRSELKGLHTVKQEPEEPKPEPSDKDPLAPAQAPGPSTEPPQPDKQPEDVYEFKEPEPFELELHDEKKKRTHRIFDDISPSKYTSTLSKSLSEEISEDPMRPRASSLRSPSLSPFRDFGATRDAPGRQSPEDDSKDGLFSLDDDSFPGDGSSGPIFEGFTPAKNQETYSKKSKVSKLRELIDDSPDSPADDEQSSEDESEDITMKEDDEDDREPSPIAPEMEPPKTPEPDVQPEIKEPEPEPIKPEIREITPEPKEEVKEEILPEPPKTPPMKKLELPSMNIVPISNVDIVPSIEPKIPKIEKEEPKKEDTIKLLSIPLPPMEPKEIIIPKIKIEKKLDPEPVMGPSKLEPPSSPLIDTEEDKSEPDSPARIDVLPEPPPGFLLQSEGPKIAEKLLKAINSAKRLSMSPPPVEDRPLTPKDVLKLSKPEGKLSPIAPELKAATNKPPEPLKPLARVDPIKKFGATELTDSIFGEPSNMTDAKRDLADIKKVKPKEPTPPRLQSPLNLLERRKSVCVEMPQAKTSKVLSDTIQKLSSQINQSAATVAANIPLPPFPPEDRSESSDSDDSDRRYCLFCSALTSFFILFQTTLFWGLTIYFV